MTSLVVEATRGAVVESRHRVDAVIVGPNGRFDSWGDGTASIIPRSAIKFIQALPLITTGAADQFAVTEVELALAAASHSGEAAHVDAVRKWLARIGLDESALECGPATPIGIVAARDLIGRGESPSSIHNCCSGKHAGFLTVARQLGVDSSGYLEPEHPVQRLVTESIATMTGLALDDQIPGVDGCGIPVFTVPLDRLALAMRRLVDPAELAAIGPPPGLLSAAARMAAAVDGRQFWVSGTDRHEERLGRLVDEPLVVKGGAEGVFVAALPHRSIGVALKVADGASRAAEIAISALLATIGVLPVEEVERPLLHAAGRQIGILRAVFDEGWLVRGPGLAR